MRVVLALAFSFSLCLISCKKDCFNQALYDQYHDAACTADCPGVTGCNGKTYCNECEANRQGISIE